MRGVSEAMLECNFGDIHRHQLWRLKILVNTFKASVQNPPGDGSWLAIEKKIQCSG
ncbi:hypothetical protein AA100600_2814 [Gluconobacter thailandicus F149-1 = NBRC 100600]|nr:hypothetical protein AA100600_2814 [Gluconobacter thailandicus F149-1 = NBRC 100600]